MRELLRNIGSWRGLAFGAAIIICVVGTLWALHDNEKDAATTEPTPTIASPRDPPSAVQSTDVPPEEQQATAEREALVAQIVGFEEAWYNRSWDDTPETRVDRLRPYVTKEFIRDTPLGFTDSQADKAILSEKLRQTASADRPDADFDKDSAAGLVPVLLITVSGDGTIKDTQTFIDQLNLIKVDGVWRVTQPPT